MFLPGTVTILLFAYMGLRSRLRILRRSVEASQRLQNLFDAVFEGIVVHDNGLILDANESFAAIFGYQRDEVIGMHVGQFVIPEVKAFALEKIKLESEQPYEVTGLKKDGTQISIEINGKMHTVQGRRIRLAAVSDITERKKLEQNRVLYEASQEAIKMRDEFLSIASHELKTPLTNIKLQTQMAIRGLQKHGLSSLDPARMKAFIEQTDRQADRLTRLVEEMLDVSRISAGKLGIAHESFDLCELVNEVAAAFEAVAKQAGSDLKFSCPERCPIWADRFRIEQVLSNLFSNAVKYGNGKPIQVRVEQEGDGKTRIVVEDQGIGIPSENQERIFRRFERAVSARKISGLGLGLYISKYIVEAHGGTIQVESLPGSGTRFSVLLPADNARSSV